MPKIRFFLPLLAVCACVSSVSAATVTLSVVQNEQAPEVALEISQTIEDQLFGDFFEAGHIVSNDDIRMDGSRFVEKNFGIKQAAFGLSDFLIVVYLHYGPGVINDTEKKMTYAELDTLSWRVVRVLSSEILGEGAIDVTKIQVRDFDPNNQSRLIASLVSKETLKLLVNRTQGEKNK